MPNFVRLTGMALVALIAGITEPSNPPTSSLDMSGEYDWRLLDREQYVALAPELASVRAVSGRLLLTRSEYGYDAAMACDGRRKPEPFLVVVAEDRVIVYAATELGELRFDVPASDTVQAEWTLRTSDGRLRSGRLEIGRV